MRTFAKPPKAAGPATPDRSTIPPWLHFRPSPALTPSLQLPQLRGPQAADRPRETNPENVSTEPAAPEPARPGHDFSRIPVHPESEAQTEASQPRGSVRLAQKSVDGVSDRVFGLVEENGPDAGPGPGPKDAGAPAGAPRKKAGVDSFEVKWTKNSASGPTTAQLRLDYTAKFKKDAAHDPAVAEFRQNVFTKFEVTDGPHKGQKSDTSPLHDDNYSRADDTAGNSITDVDFVSNDNPGTVAGSLDKDDVIDYSFTAEQMIIDTGDGNKEVAKRGPHTGTITGKHPRTFGGVPTTLS